jgi:hypothetical protein
MMLMPRSEFLATCPRKISVNSCPFVVFPPPFRVFSVFRGLIHSAFWSLELGIGSFPLIHLCKSASTRG